MDGLFRQLIDAGYPSLALHGGMDQSDRDYTIADFKAKLRTVMVATSIVARGLDIKDLVLVINYSAPNHIEDYVCHSLPPLSCLNHQSILRVV